MTDTMQPVNCFWGFLLYPECILFLLPRKEEREYEKLTALLLAAILCLSLAACGGKKDENTPVSSDAPANIVVDGKEVSAKDFLIEHLSAYIQSDAYLARKAAFEENFAQEAQPFAVTYAFELKMDDFGSEGLSLHFFMVKANCDSFGDRGTYDAVTMAIDYDTGMVYDQFSVDESWMEKSEKEQAIYIAADALRAQTITANQSLQSPRPTFRSPTATSHRSIRH